MIRVAKPGQAPRILRERGRRTTEASQQAFEDGQRAFTFDSTLYGAKSVKNALVKAQHGKCAFCESQVRHIAHGDVEHYRPKGGVRQNGSDPLEQPGYFWLAHVWANLLFACQLCNQSFKKNMFPLVDPSRRAHSHLEDLTAEEPMLIHPVDDEPGVLIGFREEMAFAIDGHPRARTTIEVLGLNREELAEMRLDYLKPFRLLLQALPLLPADSEDVREIRILFEQAVLPRAQYSSMMRSLLGNAS
jgi:uncharacterized protein (TIGR02646 family)